MARAQTADLQLMTNIYKGAFTKQNGRTDYKTQTCFLFLYFFKLPCHKTQLTLKYTSYKTTQLTKYIINKTYTSRKF